MKFLKGHNAGYDLTFNDVFLVPQFSSVESRMDVDLTTPDKVGTNIPIVVANMMSVAGKRMAETVTRRGGMVVLPQDIPNDELTKTINYLKATHTKFETPIRVEKSDRIQYALSLMPKRSHGVAIVVENDKPVGIFTEHDAKGLDLYTKLEQAMSRDPITLSSDDSLEKMYKILMDNRLDHAPVVSGGKLVGLMSKKGIIRSMMYQPALDSKDRLLVAAALGPSRKPEEKTQELIDAGVDVLVVDTAHGHQQRMLDALKKVRSVAKNQLIVAGNVVTAEATEDLIEAGADIVKVGVGPGAACTTRMVTGVGRPQISSIMECSRAARELGKTIWADGGTKHPRDFALALAAGASNVMVGTWFARTHESPGDIKIDGNGKAYKEHFGMASKRAVTNRNDSAEEIDRSLKEYFREGISDAKMYIDKDTAGVEDIIDQICAGVRSSMTYAGANSIEDFQEKAVMGVQSASGYAEGAAHKTSW